MGSHIWQLSYGLASLSVRARQLVCHPVTDTSLSSQNKRQVRRLTPVRLPAQLILTGPHPLCPDRGPQGVQSSTGSDTVLGLGIDHTLTLRLLSSDIAKLLVRLGGPSAHTSDYSGPNLCLLPGLLQIIDMEEARR